MSKNRISKSDEAAIEFRMQKKQDEVRRREAERIEKLRRMLTDYPTSADPLSSDELAQFIGDERDDK